ncbi:hypothetical protein BGZ74_004615 [Mortierella antarctica]|nr:hypothetical protein BGZ74_004615 [Mortierella antarctica]
MSSRQQNGLRQIATRSSSIAPTNTAESSTTPTSTAEPSLPAGLRSSSFWVQEGMSTLFDWITDPHNWARMQKKNPVAGQKQQDIRNEICQLVNRKHNTNWTEPQVKSKITYVKKKYREAAALNSTGEGTSSVRQKQEEVCPLFERLHPVLGSSLSANPPPFRQSGSKRDEIASSDDSDEESSDLDVQEEASSVTDDHYSVAHPSKRRKGEGLTPTSLNNTIDRMQQYSDRQLQLYDQTKSELQVRQEAVDKRERELAEKLMRMSEEANKRAEEARIQLRQELAAERAEFKKEVAEFKKEMSQERAELKQDRVDLKREWAEFMKEREELKAENSSLKKELAVRSLATCNH